MDAPYYNGAPGREHDPGRSDGRPTRYRCLTCGWKGWGSIARANHWQVTGHQLIVPKDDPRFEAAPAARKVG